MSNVILGVKLSILSFKSLLRGCLRATEDRLGSRLRLGISSWLIGWLLLWYNSSKWDFLFKTYFPWHFSLEFNNLYSWASHAILPYSTWSKSTKLYSLSKMFFYFRFFIFSLNSLPIVFGSLDWYFDEWPFAYLDYITWTSNCLAIRSYSDMFFTWPPNP